MDLIWRSTNVNQHHRLGGIAVWKCRKSCRANSRPSCKGLTWGLDTIYVYNRFELRFSEDDSHTDRLINEVLKESDLPPLAVMGNIWEEGITSYLDEEGPWERRCQHGLPPKRPRELTWWAGISGAVRRPSDEERERRRLLGEELDRLTAVLAAFKISRAKQFYLVFAESVTDKKWANSWECSFKLISGVWCEIWNNEMRLYRGSVANRQRKSDNEG